MNDKGTNKYIGDEDFDEILDRCMRIMQTKAIDYAEKDDRLAEIRDTAEEMEITMKQVLGVYMNKHYSAFKKWVKGRDLKGEPIEDKLVDIIVYSMLAYKLVKEERRCSSTKIPFDKITTSVKVQKYPVCDCGFCTEDNIYCMPECSCGECIVCLLRERTE